ncbi:hypothetical protein IE53DRAFT_74566 [Violaceomyces palustris]|uniref:Uncharacterized protein n=1 Tax=Violaceomyces palustris TaxID=1673888 RepID=A0ACD0NYQ4_9BASI|nr:hypothetical protein IE53DRAFT_74566 [Violaceomyces palustris]
MEKPVLDLFTSIGGLEGAEAVDLGGGRSLSTGVAPQGLQQQQQEHQHQQPPEAPCIARLTYSAPYQALRAIRRNGEIVSGACIVGVRWEDDNLHQISLTGGIDAPFFGGGPITSSPSLSSNLGQVSHGDGVGVGGPSAGVGSGGMSPFRGVSLFGSSSSNAGGGGGGGFLMGSKDPSEIIAKKAGRGDGKQANNPTSSSTKEPSSQGFVGRIADGIFGW